MSTSIIAREQIDTDTNLSINNIASFSDHVYRDRPSCRGLRSSRSGFTYPRFTMEADVDIVHVAGASLTCFLGSYGKSGIIITAANGPADTPRAHISK